jgi:hypothetical protein
MMHPPIGEPGSAGWQTGNPIPETLILCDLFPEEITNLPFDLPPFPNNYLIYVQELDLSGNALVHIPDNLSSSLPNLR